MPHAHSSQLEPLGRGLRLVTLITGAFLGLIACGTACVAGWSWLGAHFVGQHVIVQWRARVDSRLDTIESKLGTLDERLDDNDARDEVRP